MIRYSLCMFLFLLFVPSEAQILKNSELLPLDSKLIHGKLKNGFSYYVKHIDGLSNTIKIQFVVKAGFAHEDKDQVGLSHVLEHLALKGSTHFPKAVFHYFQPLGMEMGTHITANTADFATIYGFSLPTNTMENLNLALQITRDIAGDLLLRSEDIEIERQAVIAEILRSRSKDQREANYISSRLVGGVYSAEKILSLNSVENIKSFRHEQLIRFYKEWYRPELQAIMVFGDIKEGDVVDEIRSIFSDLYRPDVFLGHRGYSVYTPSKSSFGVFADDEQDKGRAVVRMYGKHRGSGLSTIGDLKKSVCAMFYRTMTEARLRDIGSRGRHPVKNLRSSFQERGLMGFFDVDVVLAVLNIDSVSNIRGDVIGAMRELYRLDKYGFTDAEFDKAKEKLKKEVSSASVFSLHDAVQSCLDNFLYGSPTIDLSIKQELIERLIDTMPLKEVNVICRSWLDVDNFDVVLSVHETQKSVLAKSDWRSIITEARKSADGRYSPRPYKKYERIPVVNSNTDVKVKKIQDIGVSEIQLGNGIKVILKPFEPSAGRRDDSLILVHGFSRGGAALYSKGEYFSALTSAEIVGQSGIGNLDRYELIEFLNVSGMQIFPYVNDYCAGIRARSNISGLNDLFSMIYQYFAHPPKNKVFFDDWKDLRLKEVTLNPETILFDSVNSRIRMNPLDLKRSAILESDYDSVYRIFRELFCDPSSFTVVVSGNFRESDIIPIVTKYLGQLPNCGSKRRDSHNESCWIPKKVYHTSMQGHVEASSIELVVANQIQFDSKNIFTLEVLRWLLEKSLTERLREREKGVYSVEVAAKCFKFPVQRFALSVYFKCAADKADLMVNAALNEIDSVMISKINVKSMMLYDFISAQSRGFSSSLRSNSFWQDYLYSYYFEGVRPYEEKLSDNDYNSLVKEIREFAFSYLRSDSFSRVKLMPLQSIQNN